MERQVGLGAEFADFAHDIFRIFIRREERRYRAFFGETYERRGGLREMFFARLKSRVDPAVDRDGVSALSPRGEGVDPDERIGVEAAIRRQGAFRSGRGRHE